MCIYIVILWLDKLFSEYYCTVDLNLFIHKCKYAYPFVRFNKFYYTIILSIKLIVLKYL